MQNFKLMLFKKDYIKVMMILVKAQRTTQLVTEKEIFCLRMLFIYY